MSEENTTRNLDRQILVGKSKVLEGHRYRVDSVFVKDNLIISGSADKTIRITLISLFPRELSLFQSIMDSYYLAPHLEREIKYYFGAK